VNAAPLKIGILGSGHGSNARAVLDRIHDQSLNVEVVLIGSDQPNAGILELARAFQIPGYLIPAGAFRTRLEPGQESSLAQALQNAGAQLVVLAGFMRVIKAPLLRAFPGRILNIHPSLLPEFKGLAAWKQALEAGVPETGCTVHWVDDSLDGGPVIRQETVPVFPMDTPETLHARIQEAEHRLLPEVLADLADGTIRFPGSPGG